MNKFLLLTVSTACLTALAANPSITNVRIAQDAATRTVSVTYDLAGAPAVVTLDGVATNHAAMADGDILNVSGAANRLVPVGTDNVLRWLPPPSAGFGPFAAGAVSVSLKAWATNAPPDWMVIDLSVTNRVRYYATSNAIPGGISDTRYKTSYLVMRRIPAAGVVWRMGSPSTEAEASEYRDNEHTHYVTLDEDYYIGIHPVTFRQFYYLNGNNDCDQKTNYTFTAIGGTDDDWPVAGIQYVCLRSWMHDQRYGCTDNCGVYNNYWPRDGHAIDAAYTHKCLHTGGENEGANLTYTPYLRRMRDKYGLEFDIPTDAQWEFACRGGATEYESRYGDIDDIAWYAFNSSNETYNCCVPHPVGLKMPNGYGLYDMLGGIAELCLDFYVVSTNSVETQVNPEGPSNVVNDRNASRVTRGGSFDAPAKCCRSAMRKSIGCTAADNFNFSAFGNDTASPLRKQANGFRLWLPAHAAK